MDFARFSASAVPSGNRLHGVLENPLVYRWFSIETSIVDFPVAACLITEGYRYLLHTHLYVFLFPPEFWKMLPAFCVNQLWLETTVFLGLAIGFPFPNMVIFWNRNPQSAYMIFVYSFVLMVPYGSKSHHSFQCYPLVNVDSSRHRKWPSRNSWFTHDLPMNSMVFLTILTIVWYGILHMLWIAWWF